MKDPHFFAWIIIVVIVLNIAGVGIMIVVHDRYLREQDEEQRFSRYCKAYPAEPVCHSNGSFK